MSTRIHPGLIFFGILFLAMTASAQLGGGMGWVSFPVSFKVQWPTNAAESQRYWFTNNIYHCQAFSNDGAFAVGNTTLPRTEQRFEPDYTNGGKTSIGEIQYQSMEMAPSNENSYCVFQIHSGDSESDAFGSTTFMLFWFTNNNGSVRDYSGTQLASNLGNKWFQVNVDHNLVNHIIKVWINQSLVWTQLDNGAQDFYFKDGVYEQDHNPTLQMDTYITNILMWTNSGLPAIGPLTWTGSTNNVNVGAWDIQNTTNWVNTTNGSIQFYQNGCPVTFNDTAHGTTVVSLQTSVQPASMTVNSNIKNYGFTGAGSIGGNITLIKQGGAVLTNATANTFTGGVQLNGGILDIDAVETPGASGPLGASGAISFGGGTLQYNSSGIDTADYSSRFSTAASQQYNLDVPLLAASGTPMTVTCASALNSSGGTLTKNGRGTLKLGASNAYTGNTTINAGTLALSGLGSIPNSPNISITAGAMLDVSGLSSTFTLEASQTLGNSAPGAFIGGNIATASGTLSLVYSGTPCFVVTNGTLTLATTTPLIINNTGAALGAGTYPIIGVTNAGSIAGTIPASITVAGGGVVSGTKISVTINQNTLDLVVTLPMPHITGMSLNGGTLILAATNGTAGGQYVLLESTNLTTPFNLWTPVLTNVFDSNGNLNLTTNVINVGNPAEFYMLSL